MLLTDGESLPDDHISSFVVICQQHIRPTVGDINTVASTWRKTPNWMGLNIFSFTYLHGSEDLSMRLEYYTPSSSARDILIPVQ